MIVRGQYLISFPISKRPSGWHRLQWARAVVRGSTASDFGPGTFAYRVGTLNWAYPWAVKSTNFTDLSLVHARVLGVLPFSRVHAYKLGITILPNGHLVTPLFSVFFIILTLCLLQLNDFHSNGMEVIELWKAPGKSVPCHFMCAHTGMWSALWFWTSWFKAVWSKITYHTHFFLWRKVQPRASITVTM